MGKSYVPIGQGAGDAFLFIEVKNFTEIRVLALAYSRRTVGIEWTTVKL